MKNNALVAELKSKYAEKTWNETIQLVRRCMEKAKPDFNNCETITKCLQKISESVNVFSFAAMVSRLEMIAKQQGLRSHLSPSEMVCFLTADLFYIEVVLQRGGAVEDVRVAKNGEAPMSSSSLLQILRMKNFHEFSQKLQDLDSYYHIPGDGDVKVKIYTSLSHLENDLLKISHLPRCLRESNLHIDVIMNGRVGNVQSGREGMPMTIKYYISPFDILMGFSNTGEVSGGQVALVTVGGSQASYKLQMESLIPSPPQIDTYGFPVFKPLAENNSEMLPGTFLLKLQPPLPILMSFVEKMNTITGGAIHLNHLEMEPLPQLLTKSCRSSWDNEMQFSVPLPSSERHSYLFSLSEWRCKSWVGVLMHTVPFNHPGQVPLLLDILRHQSAINVLLASCFSDQTVAGSAYDMSCEVLPESSHGLSVSFSLENSNHLAVLLVNVMDCHHLSCQLLMPDVTGHNLDNYISRVLMRCMSVPITMRAIRRKVAGLISPSSLDTNPQSSPRVKSTSCQIQSFPVSQTVGTEASHGSVEVENQSNSSYSFANWTASGPVVDDANTDAVANPSPCAFLDVCSRWVPSGFTSEML